MRDDFFNTMETQSILSKMKDKQNFNWCLFLLANLITKKIGQNYIATITAIINLTRVGQVGVMPRCLIQWLHREVKNTSSNTKTTKNETVKSAFFGPSSLDCK